jgi:carbamoyltransferase
MRILGISGAFGHDSAAAIVVDGRVLAACEEERFTRQKRAMWQPAMHSVQACLDIARLSLADIDLIAIGWDPDLAPHDHRMTDTLARFLATPQLSEARLLSRVPEIRRVPHHLAHAALGYFTSGLTDAAVLVADGQGEDVATTIFHGNGTKLTERCRFGISDSLGFFYAVLTHYLGFSAGNAGKTMGLAPLGSVSYNFPEIELLDDGYRIVMPGADKPERSANWMRRLGEVFGPPATPEFRMDPSTGLLKSVPEMVPHLRDAAASAQAALERTILHLASLARVVTGSTNLVLSGGVALNCSANGRLRQAFGADIDSRLFVSGAVHDGGTALGAALAAAAAESEPIPPNRSRSLFTGPAFDPGPAIIRARELGLAVSTCGRDVASAASRCLAGGQVGGWFRGQAEYGPRALGGRSIIARSDQLDVSARVNAIKGREPWRPLAPAMDTTTASALEIETSGLDFMVEARWLADVPGRTPLAGIVHADDSVRPLVIDNPDHPFADLLEAVRRDTGSGVVTNTSFNLEYEPIVNSPMDALRTFVTSDLDFLVIEDTLVNKR